MTQPIIFVHGKPGSGKGTVCAALEKRLNAAHFSAGELLRNEAQNNPDSEMGKVLVEQMKQGIIVDPRITVSLLSRAMEGRPDAAAFLIDGFPREMSNLVEFTRHIDENRCYVLHIKCSDETCYSRIHTRNSGRIDDNDATIQKRLDHFAAETTQVVQLFAKNLRLFEIDGEQPADQVVNDSVLKLIHLVRHEK